MKIGMNLMISIKLSSDSQYVRNTESRFPICTIIYHILYIFHGEYYLQKKKNNALFHICFVSVNTVVYAGALAMWYNNYCEFYLFCC